MKNKFREPIIEPLIVVWNTIAHGDEARQALIRSAHRMKRCRELKAQQLIENERLIADGWLDKLRN